MVKSAKTRSSNTYCIGVHSLLSGRIEKKRNLEFEKGNHFKTLSKLSKDQIPPCYWSINAFGKETFKIEQGHASKISRIQIPETVSPYSTFYLAI